MKAFALLVLPLLVSLSACDQVASQLGIDDPAKVAAAKEADGKAIGSACRHAMRAIEDCYTLNPKAQKAAVFAGWKDMDEYMRENKLEGVTPVVPRTPLVKPAADGDSSDTSDNSKPSVKEDAKPAPAKDAKDAKDDKPAASTPKGKSR